MDTVGLTGSTHFPWNKQYEENNGRPQEHVY
jgi:hypothetical protein